jgi:predicted phosphodiesterase
MTTEINLDNIKDEWPHLSRVQKSEVVLVMQNAGIQQSKIAVMVGCTPRNIKARKADSNVYILKGEIPTGSLDIKIDRKETLEDEMDRRDRISISRKARKQITSEVVGQGAVALLQELFKDPKDILTRVVNAELTNRQIYAKLSDENRGRVEEEAWMMISDLHHCRVFKDSINEEVTAKALDTFDRHAAGLLARQRRHSKVDVLNMAVIGDIMHGVGNYLYQDREVSGNSSYQIATTAHLLVDFILKQSTRYKNIRVYCVAGNHGRKDRSKNVINDNYEIDMYRIVQAFFSSFDNVEVVVEDTEFYYIAESLGRRILLMHGDTIKAGNPQALIDSVRKYQDTLPEFDDVMMGHWHRQMMLPLPRRFGSNIGRWLLVNGTASIDDQFLETFGGSPSLGYWFTFCNGKRLTGKHDIDLFQDVPAVG